MANSKTKRQHYVSKFYLKGFTNDRNKTKLFVYDKEKMVCFLTNIKNIAHENFFYDVTEEQVIEKVFSQFEGQFNIALKKIIETEDLSRLTKLDKDVLAKFIAIQFLRTKEMRIQLKEGAEAILNLVGKHNIPNFKEGDVMVVEKSLKGIHLKSIFENFIYFSKLFMNKSWKLCINNSPMPFWASDNPCAVHNDLEPEPFKGNLGIECKGFQLHFPLSSKLLLIMMDKNMKVSDLSRARFIKKEQERERFKKIRKELDLPITDLLPKREIVGEERVTFENNLQIFSSTRFIFSQNNNFILVDKYLAEHPYYGKKDRKRMKVE